ncbi:flagellar hook-basal body complex protein FliE [Jeotgalibaca ciconiae]|uniref:flagellar hook-basal body complex protein FliE n=1 Tax=Jeotgalibaca ciconiae TaxID=2496265 RepID=UPI001582DD4B|nr:flagellar hook-basal body complex protein FliE [Jeotgalibaca ciconiae]HJB23111.1 flagellar hook-basal body complex protein FliE [Candidatus Jeotgalibaca pullicola]
MNIEAYTNVINKVNTLDSMSIPNTTEVKNDEFSSIFNDALNSFTTSQQLSDQAVESLVVGDDVALHNIMIQTTEAQLSLELAIQVRNKCLEAYNDIKNMQF